MASRSIASFAKLIALVACLLLAGSSPALAQCVLSGESVAEPNPDDPSLGAWKYTITVEWDTGTQYGLSHLDLLLALEACPNVCEEFPFAVQDTAGYGSGIDHYEEPCTLYYAGEFECNGDPSIGVAVPLVKFEPLPGASCEPDAFGAATFSFYTDWGPIPVSQPNALLALKAGPLACFGELTGELPECDGSATDVERITWGQIKSRFRR
ncbi:MAG: hypothetical protein KAY24_02505 [Candidatus Eisenbacteria sp.]|nr:hypothetical protein [Candidatus Eisenbacteria bacterium]